MRRAASDACWLALGLVLGAALAFTVDRMSEHTSDCACLRCSAERERLAAQGHFIANARCPKCGAQLLGNAHGDEWCSMVGCGYWLSGDAPRQTA